MEPRIFIKRLHWTKNLKYPRDKLIKFRGVPRCKDFFKDGLLNNKPYEILDFSLVS